MAALQKIRSKGKILMIIIGLGLFAFIAESGFQSITGLTNADKQKVGEAFGETLTIQDFQNRVEQLSNIAKMQKQRAGQSDALTDQEQGSDSRTSVVRLCQHECHQARDG